MAEGGYEFGYEDPDLDDKIDHDDDDDDDGEQEVDTARPFQPGAASTPYHGGEQHQMHTMHDEQSGLPDTSYDETPLIGAQSLKEKSWDELTKSFPNASATSLETSYSKTGRLQVKMFGAGKKNYYLYTKDKSTGKDKLNPSLSKEIKDSLGQQAEQLISENTYNIQEQRKITVDAERQLREQEKIVAQKEKEHKEIQNLQQKLDKNNEKIKDLEEQHVSAPEIQAEIDRLTTLKKNYETEIKNKNKEVEDIKKLQKSKEKAQRKVAIEREKLAKIERERNLMQERLNSTKTLDELNEQLSELKRKNEQYQEIIQDENASPSEREAAEARMSENNEQRVRLQAQVGERERAMPLRERIKEIFKKYGVTVTAIFVAAGVTIGAVIDTITNALKSMGKKMANGLKTLGSKIASLLPGLIGTIVSFLFKTAGQAIGFLAEHTWLLILAVVAFIFEKYIKRRR